MIHTVFSNNALSEGLFLISFSREKDSVQPKAGQFYMIKPAVSAVFLGRPVSVMSWERDLLTFLVARRGKGTQELADLRAGEKAELIGPLGNAWADFLPPENSGKPIALVSGGVGIAPLNALISETPGRAFHFYAGFKTKAADPVIKGLLKWNAYSAAEEFLIVTEDGTEGSKGRSPDFLEAERYAAVCACGPEPMMKAVAEKCKAAGVPCFASIERRMACGVGACMGCAVKTERGNRRCCADGPIFNTEEISFND